MERKKKVYSLYKGDNEIAFGTVKEIAKQLGISELTVRVYKTAWYKNRPAKRKNKNRRELVVVEDEEY